ncbi:protein kinase family protein [Paraclostridium bifermentans]|uniref:protein kinase family protein n=1 Tax=Paraclostridium bifermentans TaxID=1490 RepID=UPI00359C8586
MDKYYNPGEIISGYSIIKIIGQGRYGIVYLVENKNFERYILKQLKNNMLEETKEKLFYEQEILNKLNDSRFPKFISLIEEEITGYVLEYIEGIVFEDLLIRKNYNFSKKEIYNFADQLLDIIELLHKNNVVHRDIRLPNVILKKNKELVLIDFGLARYIDNKKYVREMDYWYLGDFLIHLFYTSYYEESNDEEKPWYDELNLDEHEKLFLKKLMGIEPSYIDIESIRNDLNILKSIT